MCSEQRLWGGLWGKKEAGTAGESLWRSCWPLPYELDAWHEPDGPGKGRAGAGEAACLLAGSSCLPSPRVRPCLLSCRVPGSSTELRGLWKCERGASSSEKLEEEEDGEHLLALCALLAPRPAPLAMLLHPGEPQINLIRMLLGQMGPFPLRCVTLFHAAEPPRLLLPPHPLFPRVFWASLSWSAWASPLQGERQALRPLPAAWQGAGSAQQWIWLLGALGGEERARTNPRPQGGAQQPGSLW